jgi:hypothetical protein
MNDKKISDTLMVISILTAVIAGYVSVSQNNLFKLAGTQWMLIAIIFGIYAMYAKSRTAA